MKVLVTGGAGYIGSHMVASLLQNHIEPVVFDNLSYGHKQALPKDVKLITADLEDIAALSSTFEANQFDAVLHFAAFISMAESVENPRIYFRNNVFNATNLLDCMVKFNVKNFIFSSTAGVYGNPLVIPIPEDHPTSPTNPYGDSKLMVEKILKWYDQAYGIKFSALRYFNASGASLDGKNGEDHDPETHIIPLALKSILNKTANFEIFGSDYPTKDGTCIRDYIHVVDLVNAHLLALDKLVKDHQSTTYNVGTGNGFSNNEVVEMIKKVTGAEFEVEKSNRRPGDASELVASAKKIQRELAWLPEYSDLETIIKTAWSWHQSHPDGFGN